MSWNGQQSYPHAAAGHMASARQHKRSQSQARYNAHAADDQQDGWFGQRDKPAKATRLDIVTDYQQALHQANGITSTTVNGISGMPGASGISEQRTSSASVTMELMAKQQRQREAKEQAEAAQRRRADALRAAEQAEEEYLRACEAERLAFQDGGSGAAPPPPPEEPKSQAAPRSQPMTAAQPLSHSPVTSAAVDVSQDEVLLEWARSPDGLKRQWAAWYFSNPGEWIDYKSQYATKQSQQQPQQGDTPSASPGQPQVVAHSSPDNSHARPHASASQPMQHAPQQQFPPQQAPHEQPPPQSGVQQQPWQQAQQPQQQHEPSSYHQAPSEQSRQQWPPPSLTQAPASISTSAPSPSQMHALQQPPWISVTQRTQPQNPQPQQLLHTHTQPTAHMATQQTAPADGSSRQQADAAAPWHTGPQPSATAAFVQPGPSSAPAPLAPPTQTAAHANSHAAAPWSAAPAPRGHAMAPMLEPGPPSARGRQGSGPQPLAPLDNRPIELPPAPSGSQAPTASHNGGLLAAPPSAHHVSTDADRQFGNLAVRSPEWQRPGERPQGFVRGGRHKPAPPPATQPGPRSNGSAGPGPGHAWRPQQEPMQLPVGAASSPGFAADPGTTAQPRPQAGMQDGPSGGGATGNLPHGQPPVQQWNAQAVSQQRPPARGASGSQGVLPPWMSGAAPRGFAGAPQGASGAPATSSLAAPSPPQRQLGPGAWQPRAPGGGTPPVNNPGLPAPRPWQAPHPSVGDAGVPRGSPLPHASAPLGPPQPLAGGPAMTPPGVMPVMGALPPAMPPSRPQPLAQQGPAAPRPPLLPPPQAPAQHGGSLPDPPVNSGGVRPRADFDSPGGSPTPRPGPKYGMHSPQAMGMDPAKPRHGRAAPTVRYGGGMGQPPGGPQGVSVVPGPYQGRPLLGDGAVAPEGPGHGFRPPGFMPAMPQPPGPRFQGQLPARPPREMLNGPRGLMGGPTMHGRPGMMQGPPLRPNGPYMPPPRHARPHF